MVRYHYIVLIMILFGTRTTYGEPYHLPDKIEESFEKACATQDVFVISAVRNTALESYSNFNDSIKDYFADDCKKATVPKEILQVHEEESKKRDWQMWIDAGFTVSSGNTQEKESNVSVKWEHEVTNWKNNAEFIGVNQKGQDKHIAEEYRVSGSSRYKWRDAHYFFSDVDYVNDRFSGYTYRISETLGYGYVFNKNDNFLLEGEGSIGGRHSKITTDREIEHSLLQKFTGRFKKDITKHITFTEEFSVSFGEDATISKSDANITTRLIDELYLKLRFNVEHISDPPVDTKNTDTITTLNLGYHF